MPRFATVVGSVVWEADAQGIDITFRNHTRHLLWDEVSAAGLVHLSAPDVPDGMPTDILPGLDRLFDLNRWLAREQRQLVLARGRSTFRAVRIPIPVDEPEATALVEEVRKSVGDHWVGEVSMKDHQPALGLSTPWWFYPLFGLGFVAFGLTILLAVGAYQGLTEGDLAGVPPLAWLALLFWVVLVGAILYLYRRRA